jgi:ribose 5-phosphate isomerase B
MKIAFANDHAGFTMRTPILTLLKRLGHEVLDFGSDSPKPVDYPDYAIPAVRAVIAGEADRAILVCGTGMGMCIVANKFPGIRCTLCTDHYMARYARTHNDANVLALRGRAMEPHVNLQIVKTWLQLPFESGRHVRRLKKIAALEAENFKNNTK